MKAHQNILKEVLLESGNDPLLSNVILSYLYPCDICKCYCIKAKKYYVEDDNGDWRIMSMCYDCMVETMLNHNHGKSAVLTFEEHQKYLVSRMDKIYHFNLII